MPSDLAKKKAAKKKEAAKARQRPRKGHEENGDAVTEPQVAEEKIEEANGRETTGDGEVDLLAWLAWQNPHMLFLDEPTNHLDIETIDALADAINEFEGGMMLVSHDFRLIQQVAQEIWVCEKQTITKWPGDILAYKEHLKSKLVDEEPQLTKRTHNV